MDFIGKNYVSDEYLESIQRRETIMSFSFGPSIVFLYSLVPSSMTCLSIATFAHWVKWNNYKVRLCLMATICPSDTPLIIRLINELYYGKYNLDLDDNDHQLKTKKDVIDFFCNNGDK
jgi:lichenan operon transcriptional antiterminator